MKLWVRILVCAIVGVILLGYFGFLFLPFKPKIEVKYPLELPKNYQGEKNSYSQQNELIRAWVDGVENKEVEYEEFIKLNPEVSYPILSLAKNVNFKLNILLIGKIKTEDQRIIFTEKVITTDKLYPVKSGAGGNKKIFSFRKEGNDLFVEVGPSIISSILCFFLGGVVTAIIVVLIALGLAGIKKKKPENNKN